MEQNSRGSMMPVEDRLKEARRQAGLSQLQVASEIGTQQNAIWKYETGRRMPNVVTLHRLAKLYQKSMEWFLEEPQEPDEPQRLGSPQKPSSPQESQPDRVEEKPTKESPQPAPTPWKLEQAGKSTSLQIFSESPERPGIIYHWSAVVWVGENGFIDIGQTRFQSAGGNSLKNLPEHEQPHLKEPIRPIRKIAPQDFQKTCNQLANRCRELSTASENAQKIMEENRAAIVRESSLEARKKRVIETTKMIRQLLEINPAES